MKTLMLISLALLAVACKKNDFTFTLDGSIQDATFSKGLEGATISIEEKLMSGEGNPETYTATSDASGHFSLTFKRKRAFSYVLRIEKANYFAIYKEIPFSDFSTEKPLEMSFSTTAKAWFKIVFVNTAPSSDQDEFHFTKQEGKQDCVECCPKEEQVFYGMDTVIYSCVNDGNTNYSYGFTATNPDIFSGKEFFTPAFDTTIFYHYW